MLSMADQLGRIHAAIPGLAHRARVSLKATEEALELFLQPDPYSRSKEHDGRRIEVIDGGWRLLNYSIYREQKDEDARREKNRIYQQRFRDKAAAGLDDNRNPGYIYYAQNGEHLKIGFSKNPWSRISELKCACPTLELVAIEKGSMQDEKNRHEMFSHLHHDREWFRLEADLLEYINSLPILEKLNHGRYRNTPPAPVVQSVAKNVVNYGELRRTTKAQAEGEVEAEAEGKSKKTNTKTTAVAVLDLPEWIDRDAWNAYLEMRRKKRAVPTEGAVKGIIKQLGIFRNKGHDPNAILETSTRSNWTDVYEPKTGAANGTFNRSHGKTGGNIDALATALALVDQRNYEAADEVLGATAGAGEPGNTLDLRGRSGELPLGGYRSGPTIDLIPPPR
jgi:hypothetical protein